MDEVVPGAAATAVAPRSRHECRGMAAVDRARHCCRSRRHVGGVTPAAPVENPLANATFSRVTNWAGSEEQADISPDGRFVAFVADRVGQFDLWVGPLGTGDFKNLTRRYSTAILTSKNLLRSLGFNGEGSGGLVQRQRQSCGREGSHGADRWVASTRSSPEGNSTPAWSPENGQLAFIGATTPGDPLFLADRMGAEQRPRRSES